LELPAKTVILVLLGRTVTLVDQGPSDLLVHLENLGSLGHLAKAGIPVALGVRVKLDHMVTQVI